MNFGVPAPDEEGKFLPRPVEVGPLRGDRVTIRSGVQPGEVVVTEGSFFLRAESFYNFATYVDEMGLADRYGGKSLHQQSHGESFLALFNNHSRALRALVSVSWVVKVLEATMKSVVSGRRCLTVSARCVPSTFETK